MRVEGAKASNVSRLPVGFLIRTIRVDTVRRVDNSSLHAFLLPLAWLVLFICIRLLADVIRWLGRYLKAQLKAWRHGDKADKE